MWWTLPLMMFATTCPEHQCWGANGCEYECAWAVPTPHNASCAYWGFVDESIWSVWTFWNVGMWTLSWIRLAWMGIARWTLDEFVPMDGVAQVCGPSCIPFLRSVAYMRAWFDGGMWTLGDCMWDHAPLGLLFWFLPILNI